MQRSGVCPSVCPVDRHLPLAAPERGQQIAYRSIASGARGAAAGSIMLRAATYARLNTDVSLSLKMRVAEAVVFPDGLRLDVGEKEVA